MASTLYQLENSFVLSTLDPSNSAAAQEVLDLSGESEILLTCKGGTDAFVRMRYDTDQSFPPNTRGVFYYNPRKRQRHIRFRLCDSVANFERGTDLLGKGVYKWSLPLESLTKRLGQYRPLLDMIARDHPSFAADIDEELAKRRMIMTLSPQDFVAKGQRLLDISNSRLPELLFSATDGSLAHRCPIRYNGRKQFPACSKGVFYYKQSTTAPSTIGELRFRLCLDIQSFATGTDLLLPSGLPWCISSDHLFGTPSYAVVRKQLLHDGMIKEPFPLYLEGSSLPLIFKLKQPFIVDLSRTRERHRFKIGDQVTEPKALWQFDASTSSSTSFAYTGRVVAQLEEYPLEALAGRKLARRPLLALRFLEFLTPVEARFSEAMPVIQRPKIGEFLLRRAMGKVHVWGFTPRDDALYQHFRVDKPDV